jgi:thiol-disulfide isomerase/thioredoxin
LNSANRLMVAVLSGLYLWGVSAAIAKEAEVGAKAPFFFVGTYNAELSGVKRVFLDRLVGEKAKEPKKLLLLSFFNIDCKPCKKELPFLQKLYERYKDKGLGIVVVNCDYKKEKVEEVIKYVNDSKFTFPVLKDRFQALQRRYSVESFPTMFILDTSGTIKDIRVGYNEEKMPFPLADVQKRLEVKIEPIEHK